MLRSPTVRALLAVVCIVAVAACSHRRAAPSDNLSSEVLFTIENDLNPPSVFTVYVVGEDGTQRMLGTVPATGAHRFTYRPVSSAGRFRLVARVSAGPSLGSEIFSLKDVAAVTWRMRDNTISIAFQQ